jgi:hypothetical protein
MGRVPHDGFILAGLEFDGVSYRKLVSTWSGAAACSRGFRPDELVAARSEQVPAAPDSAQREAGERPSAQPTNHGIVGQDVS